MGNFGKRWTRKTGTIFLFLSLLGLPLLARAANEGLLVDYDMSKVNETAGTIPDQSGNGFDAKLTNCKIITEDTGKKVYLTGDKSFITLPDQASLPMEEGSLVIWLKLDEDPGDNCLLAFRGPFLDMGFVGKYKWFYFQANEKGKNETTGLYINQAKVVDGKWHQVVAGFDKNGLMLYVDGQLANRKEAPNMVLQKSSIHTSIGTNDWEVHPLYLKMYVGRFKMYSRMITAEEVKQDYEQSGKISGITVERPDTVAAINEVESGEKEGKRNWELDLAKKEKPDYPALVNLQDLSGWKIICSGGVKATLRKSAARKLFGPTVAKITFSGGGPAPSVEVLPPAPIPIEGEFDAVELWLGADKWGYELPAPGSCTITVKDANGDTQEVELGQVDNNGLALFHGSYRIPSAAFGSYGRPTYLTNKGLGKPIKFPAKFISLKFSVISSQTPRIIYFDCLSFYKEYRGAISFSKPEGPSPIPVTPDTILPDCINKCLTSTVKTNDGIIFKSTFSGHDLQYIYEPKIGTLSDLKISWDGKTFQPCSDGGVSIEVNGQTIEPKNLANNMSLVSFNAEKDTAKAVWKWEKDGKNGTIQYSFVLKNKSLIINVEAPGGSAANILFGKAVGLENPKIYSVPFLNIYAGPDSLAGPAVVGNNGMFFLGMVDQYSSDAGALFADNVGVDQEKKVVYNSGAVYDRLTDGSRNNLKERVFLTASDIFEEVLPTISNPPALNRVHSADYYYTMLPWPFPALLTHYRKYGIEKLLVHIHGFWAAGQNECATATWKPMPNMRNALDPDGLTSLRKYREVLSGLGYKFGLYDDFCNQAGPNEVFDRNAALLLPNGDWCKGWASTYYLKPLAAVNLEKKVADRLHKDIGIDSTYCDEISSIVPWAYEDYDARLPGAGKFRTTYEMYARLLRNEQTVHGMTWSEGLYGAQWFYAGLVNGSYGDLYKRKRGWDSSAEPLLPDFELRKVHPLSLNLMMGPEDGTLFGGQLQKRIEAKAGTPSFQLDEFNQLIAVTIGYGHLGQFQGQDYFGTPGQFKKYYLLSEIQKVYGPDTIETINYFDGTRLVDTSTALTNGCYKNGKVYLKYKGGLEMYVNYNKDSQWSVTLEGKPYLLPAYGYVVRYKNDLLVCSVIKDGIRLEYSRSKRYVYADSHGGPVDFEGIRINGTGVLLTDPSFSGKEIVFIPMGKLEIDIYNDMVTASPDRGCSLFGFSKEYLRTLLSKEGALKLKVIGCNEDGNTLGTLEAPEESGYITLKPAWGFAKYRFVLE